MQLWLGTVSDDMWWKYGWGMPHTNGAASYLAAWSEENAALCAAVIEEIWQRYGETYADQIGGFYYVNEIWNIDAACLGTDGGLYARILGASIRQSVEAVQQSCPQVPLLISPFYNTDISSAAQFGAFLSDLLNAAQLRPCDIYAGQDGGGAERSPAVIREWTAAQADAVRGRMRFWVNCETFQSDYTSKPIDRLRADDEAVEDLVEGAVVFSWEHYYRGNSLADAFKAFAAEPRQGDVDGDGLVSVTDVVMLQKWLLGVQTMAAPAAADLYADGRVDVFDLAMLKRRVLRRV